MNNTRSRLASRVLALTGLAFVAPAALSAQADWCSEDDYRDDRFCEVREFTLRADGSLAVDASPNGGVQVTAWDRNEVRVFAKVVARGSSLSRAEELVTEVGIATDGTIRAEGPNTRSNRDESWWVSYRVNVPRDYDL
ncbi:MAG: hypothetical protein R3344_13050, partial [Acidobacteriota bacterium]|nr:hypothetical protein [Acidobacteriota bacterium]